MSEEADLKETIKAELIKMIDDELYKMGRVGKYETDLSRAVLIFAEIKRRIKEL